MVKTVMIGLTCAALLVPGLAAAQLGGFDPNEGYDTQPRSRSYPSDQEIMEGALYPYGRRDSEIDRIERNFERQDRQCLEYLHDDRPQPGRAAALPGRPALG